MDNSTESPQVSVDDSRAANDPAANYVPLRVRMYESGDDEAQSGHDTDEVNSLASSYEVSDSDSNDLVEFSDTDGVTVMGLSEDLPADSEAVNSKVNTALMKFNKLRSGIASLDTSVLHKCSSQENFRFYMMRIAISNNLSLDDYDVHDILNTLLPLIKSRPIQTMDSIPDLADATAGIPVAKLTTEDDFYCAEKSDGANVDLVRDALQSEDSGKNPLAFSAQDPLCCVADHSKEEKEVSDILLQGSLHELPMMLENNIPSVKAGHEMTNSDKLHSQITCGDKNDAELESSCSAGGSSMSELTAADNFLDTSKHIYQPAGEKEETKQQVIAPETDQQISVPVISSRYSQQETFAVTSTEDKNCKVQNQVSRRNSGVNLKQRSKQLIPTSSGKPHSYDFCFPARPSGWEHIIPFIESGAIVSKANNLTKVTDVTGKLQVLRLKLFCVALRLQQSKNNVLKQVLYRLDLADRLRGGRGSRESDLEKLRLFAQDLEARRLGCSDFECVILVLGRSGVGKSATINSLFAKAKCKTDAFKPETNEVKEISGTVNGLKLRVIDTPGFLPSYEEMQYNLKILSKVKRHIRESRPDVILYVDRLDLQCMDYGELLLFRAISDRLGIAMWYDTIVVFTHGLSAPLYDNQVSAKNYEIFVAQRLRMLQERICQATGDKQIRNLHAIVENHAAGQAKGENRYLITSREAWRSQLLLFCFASKILAEADNLLRSQEHRLCARPQAPSLSFLLALMFQSRMQLKLSDEEVIDGKESDFRGSIIGSDDQGLSEPMPIFMQLTRELKLLYEKQRRIYHGEVKYKRKLFMKKDLKHACAWREEMKRRLAVSPEEDHEILNADPVDVSVHDMTVPVSFGSYNPTHRYSHKGTTNGLLLQAIQSKKCWDEDIGYDGLSMQKAFRAFNKLPFSISAQIMKDKCFKLPERSRLQTWLITQEDVACNLHTAKRFSRFLNHLLTCGLAVTKIGGNSSAGIILEDCSVLKKGSKIAIGGGGVIAEQQVACGGYMRISFEDTPSPWLHFISAISVSIMNSGGLLTVTGNSQVQFLLGQTIISGQAYLNNFSAGQMRIRACSSNHLFMVLIGLLPLLRVLVSKRITGLKSVH